MGTLQFIGWLKHHLDRRTFDGCVWVDKENQIFKILWPRADKNLTPEKLGVMFKWWTHKFGSTRNHNQPTAIKGNFRSCLNSKVQSSDIRKMKNMDTREDADDWKVFQFVDTLKDAKSNAGYKKRLRANLQESEDRLTVENDVDSTPYEPESEYYAEDTIRAEYDDVILKQKHWIVNITAYAKGKVKLWDYPYNFMDELEGERKLHVHVKGEPRRLQMLKPFFQEFLPNCSPKQLNTEYPIDPTMCAFLQKEFSNAARPGSKQTMTMQDTFCPGFIFEVDRNLNVFITRLSKSRFFFGHHGETNSWQKLETLRSATGYSEAHEHKDGVKQMVFSYKKFVHNAKVYENWLEKGPDKPQIDLIDWRVLLPVDKTPPLGHGCDDACEFYFEIEHLPAMALYNNIRSKEDGGVPTLKVSEEPPFQQMFERMSIKGRSEEPHPHPPQAANPPPPPYDSQVYVNTYVNPSNPFDNPGPNTFDNPGPDVWAAPPAACGYNTANTAYNTASANTANNIEQILQDSLMNKGYHAGHLPNSPLSNPQFNPQFNQGSYGLPQFMQEMEPNLEAGWSDSAMSPRSDMTDITLTGSPYMVDTSSSYDHDLLMNSLNTCMQPQNCTCPQCTGRPL